MDFVVSKLAMSVCALLVVSVLGGVFRSEVLFCDVDELDALLKDLSTTLERSVWSGCEGSTEWRVPFLDEGGSIEVSFQNNTLMAKSDDRAAVCRPACEAHTWLWNGTALNSSCVRALDSCAPPVRAFSGRILEIHIQAVTLDNQDTLLAFVRTRA